MSLPLVFQRVARREYDEAADYYEQTRRGRGVRFTAAVDKALAHIADTPDRFSEVYRDVRQAPVPRFRSYSVLYRVIGDSVVVISVFHAARNPAIWQGRA